jgi:hypothetical protein
MHSAGAGHVERSETEPVEAKRGGIWDTRSGAEKPRNRPDSKLKLPVKKLAGSEAANTSRL